MTYDCWKTTEPDDRDPRPGYHCHRCGAFVTDDAPDYNPRREECGACAERRLEREDDAMEREREAWGWSDTSEPLGEPSDDDA